MKITRSADAPEQPFEADTFSAPVSRRDYGPIDAPAGTAPLVSFPAGARTHWHSHPNGQVLYVTLYGAAIIGSPVINIAFNDHLGWTHTVNTQDGEDLYELALDGSDSCPRWLRRARRCRCPDPSSR